MSLSEESRLHSPDDGGLSEDSLDKFESMKESIIATETARERQQKHRALDMDLQVLVPLPCRCLYPSPTEAPRARHGPAGACTPPM